MFLSEESYPHTGDEVEAGCYICMQCDELDPITISVSEGCELPECPNCGHTSWMKA